MTEAEKSKTPVYADSKVEFVDFMGSDLSIVDNAKVSFGTPRRPKDTPVQSTPKERRLLRYLAMHNHWTPIGHVQIEMRMLMPIAIRAQFSKSSIGAIINEMSRRYISGFREYYMPDIIRLKSEDKKQGSEGEHPKSAEMRNVFTAVTASCDAAYQYLIDNDVCPEQARFILPQNLMTAFSISGTLEFYARVCALRGEPDAQKEIQEIVPLIQAICEKVAPVAFRRRVDSLRVQFAAAKYVDDRFKAVLEDDEDKIVALQDGFDAVVDATIERMKADA